MPEARNAASGDREPSLGVGEVVRGTTGSSMRLVRQAWLLARNDLRQELRDFELGLTASFFTLVIVVMFAMSFSTIGHRMQLQAIPGMLWLAVAIVGALTLTRIFEREREHDTLRALLVAPVERLSIYAAKAFVTLVVLLGCTAIVVPALMLLFPAARAFADHPGQTCALVILGCVSYAAVGTLFAAGLATSSGKNVLLSVILYPLTTPVLLFSLLATRALLEGHDHVNGYLGKLLGVDIVLVVLGAWLFEPVLVGTRGPERAATLPRRR